MVQLAIWGWLSPSIRVTGSDTPNHPETPVSIIVCAKNEAANLRKNIPLLLAQNYPVFEVLVVNDHSSDDSAEVVRALQEHHAHLRLKTVPDQWKDAPGKKRALQFGLEQANYDQVVLTDADCWPSSNRWLLRMAAPMNRNKIVLGYAPFKKTRGWLNRWERFENVLTGILYLGLASRGKPYMGVGRNLGYQRTWLLEQGGVLRKTDIASGDDDLTVGAMATTNNITTVIHPEAFMMSQAPKSISAYIQQKKRHMKSSLYYAPITQAGLVSWALLQLAIWLGLLLLIFLSSNWMGVLVIWLGRALIQIIIFGKSLKVLGQSDLLPWLPLLDIGYLMYIVLGTPLLFGNPLVKWK